VNGLVARPCIPFNFIAFEERLSIKTSSGPLYGSSW